MLQKKKKICYFDKLILDQTFLSGLFGLEGKGHFHIMINDFFHIFFIST